VASAGANAGKPQSAAADVRMRCTSSRPAERGLAAQADFQPWLPTMIPSAPAQRPRF